MRLIDFQCSDAAPGKWQFPIFHFGKINLLVGATSSGKSRLLNTIFNIGMCVAQKRLTPGNWDMLLEHDGHRYHWSVQAGKQDDSIHVLSEELNEVLDGVETLIVKRDSNSFTFNGVSLPKLSKDQTSLSILSDEDRMKPLFNAFTKIGRRMFDRNALDEATAIQSIPLRLESDLKQKKQSDLTTLTAWLARADLSLSPTLYLLRKFFPVEFASIIEHFKLVFPFVLDVSFKDFGELNPGIALPGNTPILLIKERNVDDPIPIGELSSGMKKVLLILTDIAVCQPESIYLIDEYENSLGINAIEFLPTFLLTLEKEVQFIITSHHPYLINRIPVHNWYVFHRNGNVVQVKSGDELVEKYGRSKQQAFVQLINDPFYREGAE